ncbi:MAG: hypothetical protein MUQ20_00785, partial [Deltaproteobacteria bacterium]|nr:hypothetical protein [Deltaproteobacteria bacterium]
MPFTLLQPIFLISLIAIPLIWIGFKKTSPWRLSPKEKSLFGGMRSLLLLLLVLALCDLRLLSPSDRVNLFFVFDLSESINALGRNAALAYMKKAVSGLGKEDRAGLILFGKEASRETELKNDF